MNILYLKYAMEVARTGSINKAAENLYMAQPNLSRAIKELETSLGLTVFDRTSRGMTLTPDGERLMQYAAKILRQVDEMEEMFKGGRAHRQAFSVSVPRAEYIARAFTRLMASLPAGEGAEIYYRETNALRAINNILHADYRLGIVRYAARYDKAFKEALEDKELTYELVAEFRPVLLMNKDHPLAGAPSVSPEALTPYLEISHPDPYVPTVPQAEVRRDELSGHTERRVFVFERTSRLELLAGNTEAFMWASAVPRDVLDRYGLVQRPCHGAEEVELYRDVLIHRADYRLSELDKRFITELCLSKREILDREP